MRAGYVLNRIQVCGEETLTLCGGPMLTYAILHLACAAIFLEAVYRAPIGPEL